MKSYSKLLATVLCLFMTNIASAMLGPIPIYLNSEYRTSQNTIGSTSSGVSISKQEILVSGASNIGELLDSIPGVNYESGQGNLTSLRIRGNESEHTLLIIDGSKVTITATQPNLDVIPLEIIEQIDILKGPFSALYGPGALGGIVVIKTNVEKKDSNSLITSIGSNNLRQVTFNSSKNIESGNINFSVGSSYTDGINARTDDSSGEKDSIEKDFIQLGVNKIINDTSKFKFNFLTINGAIGYDPNPAFGETESDVKPDNNLDQINFEYKKQVNENFSSELMLNHQKTKRRGDEYELNSIYVKNDYKFDNALLSFGFEKESDKDMSYSSYIKHTDIFGQYLTSFNKHNISLGYRLVNHNKFKKHHTYNLGWSTPLDNGIELNAKIGKSTNLPNHYQNRINLESVTAAALNLKPEYNNSLEFGLNYQNIQTTLFFNKTKNAFDYSENGTPWPIDNDDYYFNKDNGIENRGIEISHNTKFNNLEMDTNYTYLKSIDTSTKLSQGRRPKHSLNIKLSNDYKNFNNMFELIAKSSTFDYDNNITNGKNSGYGLINFGTSYQFDSETEMRFRLNNLLDKKYTIAKTSSSDSYNQPGRDFKLTLISKF